MTDINGCSYLYLNLPSSLLILFKGMRFGLMQVKTGLCQILSRSEVEPCKQTPVPITFNTKPFLLLMNGDLPLSFVRR